MSVCLSVYLFTWNPAPTRRIFTKFDTGIFFRKSVENIHVSLKLDKNNGHIHIMFNKIFFPENRAVYEMWGKKIVELGRPQLTIWRTRFVFWIPKATNTHIMCNIINFPLKHWLHERASLLRYTFFACLVVLAFLSLNMFTITVNYI